MLDVLLTDASAGRGRLVFIGGEAGVGKTALVNAFASRAGSAARVLFGMCDPLSTPQPLGPLADIARQDGGILGRLLDRTEQRPRVFQAVLQLLNDSAKPVVMIVEDAHWADEATLDVLRFLGRRSAAHRGLVLTTYRDDEVGQRHPLRLVLGDLATMPAIERITLPRLSEQAVATLASASSVDTAALYRLTGGNPFFITEVLATGGQGIPATVHDAVLARAARLSPPARALLDAAAVIGATVEPWLLAVVAQPDSAVMEECIASGMLQASGDQYAFRHELVRETLLDRLEPGRLAALHRAVLAALRSSVPGHDMLARLAHHAEGAGDREAVLEYAPRAAERAAALCAHREAAAQYARVLRYAGDLPPAERAALLEARAYECYLTDQMASALAARQDALALWREIGDTLREGDTLRAMSRLYWFMGRNRDAEAFARAAIEVLERLPPTRQLSSAYSNLAQLQMLAFDDAEAIRVAEQALMLAEQLGDVETIVHARNNIGSARLHRDIEAGWADLEHSRDMALDHGLAEHAARAWVNLASNAVIQFRLNRAERYLENGLAYCVEQDLDTWRLYLLGWQAITRFHRGNWTAATDIVEAMRRASGVSPVSEIQSLIVLGRVRARRGDPDAQSALDTALDLALPSGEIQRVGPVHVARAEAAWLEGNLSQARHEAQRGFDIAAQVRDAWLFGDLAWWLWRTGGIDVAPDAVAEPFRLQMAGNWRAAAAFWMERGCTYEAACALAELDDEGALREALQLFEGLGATPMVAHVTRRLRQAGVRGIPRGPRRSTRANPAELTTRELDVLELLVAGLRNAEIAERLYLSPKTVDHHVSAILAKLDAGSRTDAVRRAMDLGIFARN